MTEFDLEKEPVKKRENMVAGIVGAFLGSLIGVACIVIVGQMGYVASACGLIMAVCSLKGYELLGGALGKKGAAVSSVLILVMTYLAHQLDWAVSAASALEMNVLDAFRAIPYLREAGAIEGGAYWGGLAMLYIFTLVGAVPTVISSLRGDEPLPPAPPAAADGQQRTEAVFYPPQKGWTRPLRVSAALSMLVGIVLGIGLLLFWMAASSGGGEAPLWILTAALGGIGSSFIMMFVTLPLMKLCQAEFQLLARSGGTVWQIQLSALNPLDTYRFTKKNGNIQALRWDRLNPEEQERARASVTRAIDLLQSGQVMPGSALSKAVRPLTDLQVESEDDWRWRVTCSLDNGKRKKASIAKAFPGFAPVQGMEPPAGPVPARWSLLAIALAAALALGGLASLGGARVFADSLGASPAREKLSERPQAQAPDSAAGYTLEGVDFQMDAALQPENGSVFSDPRRDLRYAVSVLRGQDLDGAKDVLLQPIGDYRMRSDYSSFSFTYAQEEDVIIPLTAADGSVYQHGILTVYLTGGEAIHRAVALSEEGILFSVTASHDKNVKEAEVKSALLFILESVRISDEAKALSRLTGENYRDMFHLAEELDFSCIGCGYIKAPSGMFDYEDAFVDVYVPYSDAPEFLDDGRAIRSAAHGMEVTVTIAHTGGNAQTVVDAAYEAMVNAGADVYEDGGAGDTVYEEDYDVAFRQVLHMEEDGTLPRVTVLYADVRQEGYYLSASITYLLEQQDEDYPLLVEELGDVFSLTLPEFGPYEP